MNENIDPQERYPSRRKFLSTALAAPILAIELSSSFQSKNISVLSPDGRIRFELLPSEQSRLSYRITFRNKGVIDASPLGILIDGVDLCQGVEIGKAERYHLNERYALRGVHSDAVNRCNGARLALKHTKSNLSFTLDVRAFNDGVAFRFVAPGDEKPRVPDENTAFTLPARSVAWYHDFEGHYEGMHARKEIEVGAAGEWGRRALTFKRPDGAGDASV